MPERHRHRGGFWKQKKEWLSLGIVVLVTVGVIALELAGPLEGPEGWLLDKMLPGHHFSKNIELVEITDDDYRRWFDGNSPLKPGMVLHLVDAIARKGPALIAVDIDTGDDTSMKKSCSSILNPPAIGRNLTPACLTSAKGIPVIWAEVLRSQKEPLMLDRVWGEAYDDGYKEWVGIPFFPADADHVVREYRSQFDVFREEKDGSLTYFLRPSLAQAALERCKKDGIVEECKKLPSEPPNDQRQRLFDFGTVPECQKPPAETLKCQTIDAGFLLKEQCSKTNFEDENEEKCSISVQDINGLKDLTNKVVLVGGAYKAARDDHPTPIGDIPGVELVAQAIDSDLNGGGIRVIPWWCGAILDMMLGWFLVYLYFRLEKEKPATAFKWILAVGVIIFSCVALGTFDRTLAVLAVLLGSPVVYLLCCPLKESLWIKNKPWIALLWGFAVVIIILFWVRERGLFQWTIVVPAVLLLGLAFVYLSPLKDRLWMKNKRLIAFLWSLAVVTIILLWVVELGMFHWTTLAVLAMLLLGLAVVYLLPMKNRLWMKKKPLIAFLWGLVVVAVVFLCCAALLRTGVAWVNVVPVLAAVNLHQFWDHARALRG